MAELYKLTFPNGRAYIGVALNARRRFQQHCAARTEVGSAIRLVGREQVALCVLVVGTSEYLYGLEPRAIEVFQTRWPLGLNLAAGGERGRNGKNRLPRSLEKQSQAMRGKRHPQTTETRARIAATLTGRKHSPESIEKMRGPRHGPEARMRISRAQLGKKKPPRSFEHRQNLSRARLPPMGSRLGRTIPARSLCRIWKAVSRLRPSWRWNCTVEMPGVEVAAR